MTQIPKLSVLRHPAAIFLPSKKRTEMIKRFVLTALLLTAAIGLARAQDEQECTPARIWAIGTDLADWAELVCPNIELHYSAWNHLGLMAGFKYNPFTFRKGTPQQTQMRQATPFIGVRYWFDTPFTGWYAQGRLAASVYNVANVFCDKCLEGQLVALEAGGGWSKMLSDKWNISLGAGIAAALHDTTRYLGPLCGRIDGRNRGLLIFPDITISINYLWQK